jgi:hypothetical protein
VNFAARALKDHAEHAGLDAELFQARGLLVLQRRAVERQQRFPSEFGRHNRSLAVRRLSELVRHLEKQQERELLNVFEAGQPRVLLYTGIAPGPLTDLRYVR